MIRQYIIFVILILGALPYYAQKAESRLSQNTVSLGEEFTYTIEIECVESDKINYQADKKVLFALRARTGKSSPDSLKLELLSPFKAKKEKIQGKTYWTGDFSLICFDTGYLILPPISVRVNGNSVEIPPALLRVNLVAKDNNIDIYDIEENFTKIPEKPIDWIQTIKKIALWVILLGCIFALVYIVFFNKKKKAIASEPEKKLTSHEKTRQALNVLMERKMWRNNQEKEHFTELSLIIRRFLNEEFNNRFEGKTSFEIQMILRKEHFSSKQLNDLGLILNVSDMVKFAKSSVEEEGIQAIYLKAVEFVNENEKQ
tara:strand:- start:9844 stop:10788 length:945 start_codon:yes stop_codon:yes gene_type:complete